MTNEELAQVANLLNAALRTLDLADDKLWKLRAENMTLKWLLAEARWLKASDVYIVVGCGYDHINLAVFSTLEAAEETVRLEQAKGICRREGDTWVEHFPVLDRAQLVSKNEQESN